jgi:hypothetical protein
VKFSEPETKKKNRFEWLRNRTQDDMQKAHGGNIFSFLRYHFLQTRMRATFLDSFFFSAILGGPSVFHHYRCCNRLCYGGDWGFVWCLRVVGDLLGCESACNLAWPFGGRQGDVDVDEDLPPHQLEYY